MPGSATSTDLPRAPSHGIRCAPAVRPSKRSRWRVAALILVHVLVLVHVAHWKVTGRSMTPLEPSEAGETLTLGYVNAGFILLVLLVLVTLVTGRFFCGWACHVVAYQDACAWLLGKVGLRPKPIRSRLLMLVPLFAALEMFVLPSVIRMVRGEDSPAWTWHLTTEDLWARFPGPGITILTFVVVGGLTVWMLGAKGFCTYGCPYGALFGIADRFAKGRIRVTDACEGCGHCTARCTSNVRVHEEVARYGMVVDPGCMKCMDCVSVCPRDALYFGFGALPKKSAAKGKPKGRWDFTWPEEIAMAAVFFAALYAFRNLYDAIPFLLAIALSVLAAFALVLVRRLVTAAGIELQHHALKREGKLTGRGVSALGLSSVFLLFTAHSGLVQFDEREGDRLLERAGSLPPGDAQRERLLRESLAHLSRADRLGLVDTADVQNRSGQILVALGERGEAELHLRRAIELLPENESARYYLASVLVQRGALDEACEVAEELRALRPESDVAPRILALILARDPRHERARILLERWRAA